MFRKSDHLSFFIRWWVRLAATLALLATGGCSSFQVDSNNNWSRLFEYTARALGEQPEGVTLEQAAAIPYATIGIRFGDNPEGILVLATGDNEDYIWTSISHIAIETRHGRVVRTSGTGNDLSGLFFPNSEATTVLEVGESVRTMDFQDIKKFGLVVHCTVADRGPARLTILGQQIDTRQMDEDCYSEPADWKFVNTFWIDSVGVVWKSIQYTHPNSPPLTIEILRAPA